MKKRLLKLLTCFAMMVALAGSIIAEAAQNDYPFDARLAEDDVSFTITQKKTTFEGKKVKIIVDAGVYVPDTVVEDYDLLIDTIELITGLKFMNKKYPGKVEIDVRKPEGENEDTMGGGWTHGATLGPNDLLLREGRIFTPANSLLHCIRLRNTSPICGILDYGFTAHFLGVITQNDYLPFFGNFNASYNYSDIDTAITSKNAESQFIKIETESDSWQGYLYGYRFLTYLYSEYGTKKVANFYTNKEFNSTFGNSAMTKAKAEKIVSLIKKEFGKNVFKNFGKWMTADDGFASTEYTLDYSKLGRCRIYPTFGDYPYYLLFSFMYNKSFTIDFASGNRYLKEYKGYKNNSITGYASAGSAEFELYFYDGQGNKLETVTHTANQYMVEFDVKGAELIVINGDGNPITFNFDFEKMNTKLDKPTYKAVKTQLQKKGTQFTDKNSNAVYKVTKSSETSPEVCYVKTKNTKAAAVRVPDTVKYKGIIYKVTSVSKNAVKDCGNLVTLYIGENVKKVKSKAYYGNKNIQTIVSGK